MLWEAVTYRYVEDVLQSTLLRYLDDYLHAHFQQDDDVPILLTKL